MRRVPKVNIAKNALLNTLAASNKACFEAWCAKREIEPENISAIFYGVMFSGCMQEFIKPDVFEKALRIAAQKGQDIEVLFHPGHIDSIFDCLDIKNEERVSFHCSYNRQKEAQALQNL